jgi:hypothetical protein
MVFITWSYGWKSRAYENKGERRQKQVINLILIVSSMAAYFVRSVHPLLPLSSVFFMLFLINHSKLLSRALRRVWTILLNIKEILLLQLLMLFIVSYVLKLITFGKLGILSLIDYGDAYADTKYYYTFNFTNYMTIFITLLFLQTTNNSPDLVIFKHIHNSALIPVLLFNTFMNVFIIQNVLIAFIDQKYQETWIEDLQDLVEHEHIVE